MICNKSEPIYIIFFLLCLVNILICPCQKIFCLNSPLPLWQDDEVVLQCVATIEKDHRKFCLAVEGLGNRVCYLEPTSEAKVRMAHSCFVFVDIMKQWEVSGRVWLETNNHS